MKNLIHKILKQMGLKKRNKTKGIKRGDVQKSGCVRCMPEGMRKMRMGSKEELN